jgi:DNA-binding Lrp family transcriptional regulator
MLSEVEKKVIGAIGGDLPVDKRPYQRIAAQLDLEEAQVLQILRRLHQRGVIRRFGATLRHQKTGFAANAMGAWIVAEDRIETVGQTMAGFREVTHCYRRNPAPGWPYNLYTMIHGDDEDSCRATARRMAATTGIKRYTLLFSRQELKKTSMQYFSDEEDDAL